ncbi:hypothetical protein J0910_14090 [Nocardiopsis sp. CNT-189]|uniref:hypothetical protein n=1 Tax=Nocardiopsis oceanisediminis TaxID=2816862 RepID=UPI003B299C96
MDDRDEFRETVDGMIRRRAERLAGLEHAGAGSPWTAMGVFGAATAVAVVAGVSASGLLSALLLSAASIAGVFAAGFLLQPGMRSRQIERGRRVLDYLEGVRRASAGRSAADAERVQDFVQAVEQLDESEMGRRANRSIAPLWMVLAAMTGTAAVAGTGGLIGVFALGICTYGTGRASVEAFRDLAAARRGERSGRLRGAAREAYERLPEGLAPRLLGEGDRPERFAPLSVQADRMVGGHEPLGAEEAAHRGGRAPAAERPEARGGFEPPQEPSEKTGTVGGYVPADPEGQGAAVGRGGGPAPGAAPPLGPAASVRDAVGGANPERAPARGAPEKPRKGRGRPR